MCTVSMVMDHQQGIWQQRFKDQLQQFTITQQEIEEFRKLLERAREYDKKHNQPDCELMEKKLKLLKLAKELGVEINFL